MSAITAPSAALIEAAEHTRAVFPNAEVYYNQDGTGALVEHYDGATGQSYLISVSAGIGGGHTMSATTGEWSTGYDA